MVDPRVRELEHLAAQLEARANGALRGADQKAVLARLEALRQGLKDLK